MIIIINFMGIISLIMYILCLFIKPKYSIFLSVGMLICEFGLDKYTNFLFINKFLILFSILICIFKYGMKRTTKIPLGLLGILFCINLIVVFSSETTAYSFIDFITAFSTLSIGVLMFYIKWNENDVIKGLKVLSYLAIINVAIGILMKGFFLSSDLRIVSAGMTSHLVFYSSIGMYAAAVLVERFGKKKYGKFIIINLIITFLSQMRGGTIFSLILFIPIIIPHIKKLKKKTLVYSVLFSPIIIFIGYLMFGRMISRTLNIGADYGVGFLNTSSRFYVWQETLKLSQGNRSMGLGIGYIKTLDEFFTRLGFLSPHNEYIKFFVEGGYIGLGILLICFIIIFSIVYKNNCFGKSRKGMVRAVIIGFMFYSFTDNTISAIEFWAPFSLCLSLLYENTNITIESRV